MKLKVLSTSFLLLFVSQIAVAAITSGNYLVKSYNGKCLTENVNSKALLCSDRTDGNYAQVWTITASDNYVTFKNALSGNVIIAFDSYATDAPTSTDATKFYPAEADGAYTFAVSSGGTWGMHCDNSNYVVGWYVSETKSQWTVEAAEVDISALLNQQLSMAVATTAQLNTYFTDATCTALNSTYAGYTDDDLRTAMSTLPATVQELAVKVKNNAWTTYEGWDKTERTFRIASYKPYSSPTRWTSILGLGYSFGRLTNPTGVAVTAGDVIQVYVGAIPSGQTVQLEVVSENQATGSTYSLHEGMNAILVANSGNCFVQNEVDNTTSGAAPYTALSNYAAVTVHIEGGTVNGYFDLTQGDDNDDWAQLQAHLLQGGTTVELKTANLLFHMNTALVKAACPTQMVELLGEWDKVLDMEHSLMGLESFEGYWNNLLSCTDITGDSYMYASNYGTYYNTSTIPTVMSYEELSAGGSLWGPAHENGHVFQKYINMVGQTEVSNNLFSNVAVYNNGHLTSRAANISTTFQNMLDGVFWIDRGIWERTHLYFQLYQFFHILGKKSDFYPELFKALRSDPMVHTGNTFIAATDDYLKFYKTCCQVSGYDLTEFFQAYGFFVIPTLTSYTLNDVTKDAYKVEDYASYYLTVTQAEIDAAKTAVAAMSLPKANIIFIEDRITAPAATYEGAAAGAVKTAFSSEYPIGQACETGQYTTFGEDCSAYTYNIDAAGHVIVCGTGAVGFKLYDDSGNLRGLYNTNEFDLPDGTYDESGLTSGYTIQAAGAGTDVTATRDESIHKIYVADGTTENGPATYGNAATGVIYSSPTLKSTWISNATSGQAGVTLAATHNALMQETAYSSFKCLGFKPSAGNATDVLTITAPKGYVILGYYLEAGYWTATENYTLTASEGEGVTSYTTSAAPSNDRQGLKVSGLHRRQTAITIKSNQSTNTRCLMINKFWVNIQAVDEADEAPALIGRQIIDEALLVSGRPYVVRYVGNGKKAFVKDISASYYQVADNDAVATTSSIYYLYDQGDGTWKLKNYVTGNYWGAPTGTTASNYLTPVGEAAASTWTLNFSNGVAYPMNGDRYLTRSSGKLHGWASNSNSGFEIYETEAATALSGLDELTGDRWYRIRLTTPDNGFVENNTNEKNYNGSDRYPLTYQGTVSMPYVGDAINYVRVVRDGGNVHIQSANGHYLTDLAKTSIAPQNISVAYDEGFQFSNYFTVFGSDATRIVGKGVNASTTRFALYPVDDSEEGLTAWNVLLEGATDDYAQITCQRADVSGLSTIYPGGYFFLPKGAVPAASDIDAKGIVSCDVNTTTKTIAITIDPSLSLQLKDVDVIQGHQTTGKGNTMQALLRVKVTPFEDCTIHKFSVTLTGVEQLEHIAVYTTTGDELRAKEASPEKISGDITAAASIEIPVTQALTAGQSIYFWITGDVKSTATELESIDAAVTAISYTNGYTEEHDDMEDITCDISSIGNPDGAMRIYKQQQFLWTATQSGAQYYRIPTIINTADGGIAAFTDDRHTASGDLGNHRIDVVMRKSMDNGMTWDDEKCIAEGDGSSEAAYGYGDIAVARTNRGKLIGLLAAGMNSYPTGMLHMGYIESTDDGGTWTAPTDIYSSINKNDLEFSSVFTTAGKGVTFSNGRVAFAMNGKVGSATNEYIIYSDDEGATWNISPTVAFTGADESKLEIMNDNSLLMSIRRGGFNSMANRGYNRTIGDASGEGIDEWGTQSAWGDEMNANGCNADILYYSRTTEGKRDVLLHTLTKTYSTYRKDLRLYMSFDQGETWQEAFQLQPGWAAYSSMQVLGNGDLAIIFEDGSIGNEDKQDCYAINYVVISSEAMRVRMAELNGLEVTYHVMFDGNEVATADAPVEHQTTDAPALPAGLNRAFCTYAFYSDEALTNEIDAVGTNENVYVNCTANVPFEYSTVEHPRWYFIHSREQGDTNDYYANVDGTTFRMTSQTNVMDLYAEDAYKWAFIGSPYGVRIVNKAAGKPLASTAITGTNASDLTIGVTDDAAYAYNEFLVYGYGGILGESHGVVNPFTLILKGSQYGFLIYNGKMKYYNAGVSINASLGFTGYRSADMMVIDAETYPLTLSPVNGKSYATLYLPFGVTLPGDVTAYKIAVDGEWARPTAMGQELPERTAALLVSESVVTECVATVNGDASADASGNALQGVLTDTSGADLNGYVLNIVDDVIGFYRLSDGGTITAYHAYLPAPAAEGVKGFVLNWDELAVGIEAVDGEQWTVDSKNIYNLAGQRISKLQKGVNIVGGKKVLVK